MADKRLCKRCKFFKSLPANGSHSTGQCRRFPANLNGWPWVKVDDWCGEFKKGTGP